VVAVHSQDAKILLVFSEKVGGLGKSIDGGKNWNLINENFGNDVVVHFPSSRIDPNIVYAFTYEHKIFKSNDAGDTCVQIR